MWRDLLTFTNAAAGFSLQMPDGAHQPARGSGRRVVTRD
jgi:hypothetical protein